MTVTADDATIPDAVGARADSPLRRMLAPRSVAVVGAGRRHGGAGHEALRALRDYGFRGRLHAVNRSGRPVCGVPAHRAVTDLPAPVDLLVVAVPAGDVAHVLAGAGRLGVRGAVLLGSGPRGDDLRGARQWREILRVAREQNVRLLGPGCLGILNTDPGVRLNASLSPARPPRGGLALAVRSGAVGVALLADAIRDHCGISSLVSLGEEIDITGADLLAYWSGDPATRAVVVSPEAFGDPGGFARAARVLGRRKPVLAIAGAPDAVGESLLAGTGVIRTASLGETLDTARILIDQPLPAGNRIAIVGNAGGLTTLAAGTARTYGFDVVPLSGPTRAQLPAPAGPDRRGNPVDIDIDAPPARIADAVETVATSGEADILLLVLVGTRANALVANMSALTPVLDHPHLTIAAIVTGGTGDTLRFGRRSIPVFREPKQAVRALTHAHGYAAWRREQPGPGPAPCRVPAGSRTTTHPRAAPSPDTTACDQPRTGAPPSRPGVVLSG